MSKEKYEKTIPKKNGVIIPVLSDREIHEIQSPQVGEMVFCKETDRLNIFNGRNWRTI